MQHKRHLFATLLTSLASLPGPENPIPNPLRAISKDVTSKNVLVTLHVLFPDELLPALDILDRNLAQKLVPPRAAPSTPVEGQDHSARQDGDHVAATNDSAPQASRSIYLVRSTYAPPPARHPRPSQLHVSNRHLQRNSIAARLDDTGLEAVYDDDLHDNDDPLSAALNAGEGERRYVVDTRAWSCTCPGFTFALFPADARDRDEQQDGGRAAEAGRGDGPEERGTACGIGGFLRGSDVPLCKHLLACVLVEHCPLFSGCAATRVASIEEMVGWSAGYGG